MPWSASLKSDHVFVSRERNQRQSPARNPGFVIGEIAEIGEIGEPAYCL
jgi:hypothetical protein